jgi:hypothetical protein
MKFRTESGGMSSCFVEINRNYKNSLRGNHIFDAVSLTQRFFRFKPDPRLEIF